MNAGVKVSGVMRALRRRARHGAARVRTLRGRGRPSTWQVDAIRSEFDADFYVAQDPPVELDGVEPVLHYLESGSHQGRWPNAWFDPTKYLESNADVAASSLDPFVHYVLFGRAEARTWARRRARSAIADLVEPHFDAERYASDNPDVSLADRDPLSHFLEEGWREHRNPSREFDVRHYLEDNPDVAEAGINPFVHYIAEGIDEGRQLRPPIEVRWKQLRLAASPRERMRQLEPLDHSADLVSERTLRSTLRALPLDVTVVLAISHDDYTVNTGGVQQLLASEQRELARSGISIVQLSPAHPALMLADERDPANVELLVNMNGARVGVATAATVGAALDELVERGQDIDVVVHHLMGHSPEVLAGLVERVNVDRPLVWVHDFFSLCSNYALIRNDVEFCDAPPVRSTACQMCCYGGERVEHVDRMREFFDLCSPMVLAPSRSALETWSRHGFRHAGARIAPLARLEHPVDGGVTRDATTDRPLRVAHLGSRIFLKGWHVYEELALRHVGDPRFEFLQLGVDEGQAPPSNVRNVPVRVTPQDPDAMVTAMGRHDIDIVVLWTMASETFSYTVHEALSAGSFVVTRSGSGNIWPAIEANAPEQGLLLDDSASLFEAFETDIIRDLVAAAPRRSRLLVHEGGTTDELLRRRVDRALERPRTELAPTAVEPATS